MTTRREGLRTLFGLALLSAGMGAFGDAEAAKKKKASPKKPVRRKPAAPADHVNTIRGYPADVSSIILLLEGDGFRILSEDEPHARRTPASITKLMTLCLLFDALETERVAVRDMIRVSGTDTGAGGVSLPHVRPGDRISVSDAILAIVTKSANNVAVSVAEHLGGTEQAFAELMNRKARDIGMLNTNFVNSHGMRDSEQYSTAYDLAMLARYMIQHHAKHYHYFSTGSFIFKGVTHKNHNGLMREYDGMDGMKTGMTNHGWQLAASAERTKPANPVTGAGPVAQRIIGVFLGGVTKEQRNNCLGYLMDQGYITEGHDIAPSKFKYSDMACTSLRNARPQMALK